MNVCPLAGAGGGHLRGERRGELGSQVAGLDHLFRRHVKPKKQHEIKHLGEVRDGRKRDGGVEGENEGARAEGGVS